MMVATWDSTRGTDGMAPLREAQESAIRERMREIEKAQESLRRAEATRALVSSPGWPEYQEWLKSLHDAAMLQLRAAKDIGDVRGFQAQANLLDMILDYHRIVEQEASSAAEVASHGAAQA